MVFCRELRKGIITAWATVRKPRVRFRRSLIECVFVYVRRMGGAMASSR
jgi:hypothetical protein